MESNSVYRQDRIYPSMFTYMNTVIDIEMYLRVTIHFKARVVRDLHGKYINIYELSNTFEDGE
jgi:hypothetical protein